MALWFLLVQTYKQSAIVEHVRASSSTTESDSDQNLRQYGGQPFEKRKEEERPASP
jgi:hypothetical protein